MKKIICAILALVIAVCTLTSCAPQNTTSIYPPKWDMETLKVYGFFTGTVKSSEKGGKLEIDVDYRYTLALGETVNVLLTGLGNLIIHDGDGIRIVIGEYPEKAGDPIRSSMAQIISLGDGRDSFDKEFMQRYNIPPLADVSVPVNFPNLGTFDRDNTSLAKKKEAFPDCEAFRVIKITENNVYLADTETNTITVGIKGIPQKRFAVGDYIKISADTYFVDEETSYKVIDAKDITSVTRLTQSEAKRFYMPPVLDKPVIYLYPEKETEVSVKVNIDGELTCTYPEHGEDGWQNFTAKPDGTLVSPEGGEYYCLYWEGVGNMKPDFSHGFCVKGEDTAAFLTDILPKIGLTPREANEFIIYWLPILQKNEYNLISFQSEAYTDVAELEITPAPDSILRVFMAAKPLDAPVEIAPQEFAGFERDGFAVVEWGGGIME